MKFLPTTEKGRASEVAFRDGEKGISEVSFHNGENTLGFSSTIGTGNLVFSHDCGQGAWFSSADGERGASEAFSCGEHRGVNGVFSHREESKQGLYRVPSCEWRGFLARY